MLSVHQAWHIRTGQRAAIDTIDGWLQEHCVQVAPFFNVYDACVHLLRHYDQIPDLVFLGADWLARDEFGIVRLVRETWPRVAIIVYGQTPETPSFDYAPLMCTCRSLDELHTLISDSPSALLRRLSTDPLSAAPSAAPEPAVPIINTEPEMPPARRTSQSRDDRESTVLDQDVDDSTAGPSLRVAQATEPPRSILTTEELSALLDGPDHG